MATFREADAAVQKLVATVAKKHHKELTEAGVTITTLMAFATRKEDGSLSGPAMAEKGFALAGRIKITSHKDRVAGLADAILMLDGDRWEEWSEERQAALVDYELTHLEIRRDEEGGVLLDDCCRPKLKIKQHDAQVGVFFSNMEKYGKDAIDTEVVAKLAQDSREWIQPLLTWG
jgi:hypothetical protein